MIMHLCETAVMNMTMHADAQKHSNHYQTLESSQANYDTLQSCYGQIPLPWIHFDCCSPAYSNAC